MKIELTKFLESLTIGLDYIEKEILGVSPYHGQRVAAITHKLATAANFDSDSIYFLTHAAILHDCALAEYYNDEHPDSDFVSQEAHMVTHCLVGEKVLEKLPFYQNINKAILYHHERADGSGPFGKKANEVPIYAKLIHLADLLDVNFNLIENMTREKAEKIQEWVKANLGTAIDEDCANLFYKAIDFEFLCKIQDKKVLEYIKTIIPDHMIDIPTEAMMTLSTIFADLVDYKSPFTSRHSIGIAEKAMKMGRYYNFSEEECQELYIAGALHDIGKLLVDKDLLEKPGKLTSDEFSTIQNHAMGTYVLLKNIKGLETITDIAARHHEKLNGKGYPFSLTAKDLDKKQRLMACIDIYQALVEERPYKNGLDHNQAIDILNNMASNGFVDETIVEDINHCFG